MIIIRFLVAEDEDEGDDQREERLARPVEEHPAPDRESRGGSGAGMGRARGHRGPGPAAGVQPARVQLNGEARLPSPAVIGPTSRNCSFRRTCSPCRDRSACKG